MLHEKSMAGLCVLTITFLTLIETLSTFRGFVLQYHDDDKQVSASADI